jgi:hypothetical protein
VSSEAAPPVATPPGEPDAELIAALLVELDGGADSRLTAFARSYARRVGIDQLDRPIWPRRCEACSPSSTAAAATWRCGR